MRARHVLLAFIVALVAAPLAWAKEQIVQVEAGTNPDGSMYLRPDRVSAALGDNVTIRVTNVDAIFHDVAILSYGGRDIEIEVPGKTSESKTFVADTLGTFRMVCEVTGHKQKGMQGNFTVEDASAKAAPGVELPVALGLVAVAALVLRRR